VKLKNEVEAARRLLGKESIIGFSTHNIQQAKRATSFPVDYLALGPVFQTATKENPEPVTGLSGLREVVAIKGSRPLVAIGGITFSTASEALKAGADSVALIAVLLCDSSRIAENTSKMLALTASVSNSPSVS
jgi:thiamine-phosphate pyrophosphorylase